MFIFYFSSIVGAQILSASKCASRMNFMKQNDPSFSMCPESSLIFDDIIPGQRVVTSLKKVNDLILTYGVHSYQQLCKC